MLDVNHPQSVYIFAAARLEDGVLKRAKEMTLLPIHGRRTLLAECKQLLAEMQKLNLEHFQNSPFIIRTIIDLECCLHQLTEMCDGKIVEDKFIEGGYCIACSHKLADFVAFPRSQPEIYCRKCIEIVMPAVSALRSLDGFGTDAI